MSFSNEKKGKIINDLVYLKQIGGDPVEILIKIIWKFTKTPLAESTKLLNKPWKSLKKINVIPASIQKERMSSEMSESLCITPKYLNQDSDSNVEIEVVENPIWLDTWFKKEDEFKTLNK